MTDQKQKKLISRYTWICAVMGFSGVCLHNALRKKYWFQGIHRHAFFTVFGAAAGTQVGLWSDKAFSRRDFYINDYIERHPEDFKKEQVPINGEVFDKWAPIR